MLASHFLRIGFGAGIKRLCLEEGFLVSDVEAGRPAGVSLGVHWFGLLLTCGGYLDPLPCVRLMSIDAVWSSSCQPGAVWSQHK